MSGLNFQIHQCECLSRISASHSCVENLSGEFYVDKCFLKPANYKLSPITVIIRKILEV